MSLGNKIGNVWLCDKCLCMFRPGGRGEETTCGTCLRAERDAAAAEADEYRGELLNICNAKRENFEDATEFRSWAQSRALDCLRKYRPVLREFKLHVSRCDKPMTFVATTILEAIGMMELSFPKYENRKCLDWSVGREIVERCD